MSKTASMAFIHVCRHGQDLDNAVGILNGSRNEPLSDLGRSQAATVAEAIAKSEVNYATIYASPLRRAFNTAEMISILINVPVQEYPDLIERDFGVLTGRPYEDIPKYAKELLQSDRVLYFLDVEGGESFSKCYQRAQRIISDMDARHAGEHVLLVCHGDIGKMIVAARRGITWREGLLAPYFANTEVISI